MNRRLRILFTTSNFDTAGSGKVIYDLIRGLDKNKFDVEIACGDNKGDFFKTIAALGLPIHVFETKTNYRPYSSLFKRIIDIARFFKTNDYNLVHSWQWSNDWTEAIAARLAGAKWIYTKKAMGFESKHWKIKSYLSHFIVTINDEMHTYFPNKKAQRLIPLGIDTEYYNPDHFSIKSETQPFHIITVANLVPVKGIEVLIQAIHDLNDLDLKLIILGDHDNEYGKKIEALTQTLGIQNQVVFHGKQPDVRPHLVEADLYVIPTLDEGRKEGMPMALVEAMSMAVPVLGSDISGIKFVLKDFQELLFKAGDSKELGRLISKLKSLSFDDRKRIGTDLRAYCIAHFTLQDFIDAHEHLYEQLLNDRL